MKWAKVAVILMLMVLFLPGLGRCEVKNVINMGGYICSKKDLAKVVSIMDASSMVIYEQMKGILIIVILFSPRLFFLNWPDRIASFYLGKVNGAENK